MKFVRQGLKVIGIILLVAISGYGLAIYKQVNQVKEICSLGKEMSKVPSAEAESSVFPLRVIGPFKDTENPAVEHILYCATLTLCEASCNVSISSGKVVSAKYRAP